MAIAAAADLVLDTALVKKYDGFGPRYTSYPTADRFHDGVSAEQYVNALHDAQSRAAAAAAVAVRAHPVLQHDLLLLRVQQGDHQGPRALGQVHPLRRPRDRHRRRADRGRAAGRAAALGRRHADVPRARRDVDADGHAARRASRSRRTRRSRSRSIRARSAPTRSRSSAELGFNRISVGIQDFDPAVQEAVNRIQSEAETLTVIDAARANGFVSVNADLIYGLPRQTVAGFSATLDKVIAASPDRIALYSYAHVPHLFKPQRRIDVDRAAGAGDEARDPRARDREARRGRLRLHRDGPLREADRRARRRAGAAQAAPQLPGLLDQARLRHAGLRHLGDRQGRRGVRRERQDARRVLRPARRRRRCR